MQQILTLLLLILTSVYSYESTTESASAPLSLTTTKVQVSDTSDYTPRDWLGKYESLSDFLNHKAGFHIQKKGGIGSSPQVFRRGLSQNYLQVLVDGVSLNNSSGFLPNLSQVPLEGVHAINFTNSSLQAETPSGYLNTLSISLDSNTGFLTKIQGTYPWALKLFSRYSNQAAFKYRHQFHSEYSPNNYTYLNRKGTQYNTNDDEYQVLQNAHTQSFQGSHLFSKTCLTFSL